MTDTDQTGTALSLTTQERLSASMHRARLFPGIANAEGALAVILAGAELGFGPIASLTGIHLIKGKVTPSATLIAASIRKSDRYEYRLNKLSNTECEIEFFDRNTSLGVSAFTWQDAVNAGLAGGDNWKKFTRNMLFARAMSNGAKWYCPDLFGGNAVYVPEELGANVDGDGQVVDAEWSTPIAAAPAPIAGPTLDELLTKYGADAVMAAAGGGIPGTAQEVADVAATLEKVVPA